MYSFIIIKMKYFKCDVIEPMKDIWHVTAYNIYHQQDLYRRGFTNDKWLRRIKFQR